MVHKRFGAFGRAHPHRGRQRGGEAHHPCVPVCTCIAQLVGAGLGGRWTPPGEVVAVGIPGYRLHRGGDVVGHCPVDALLTEAVLLADVEENIALGVDDLLYEVWPVVDPGRGDRGIRRRHVQHPGLVLAQYDSVVRRTTLAVFGKGVLHAGDALGDAGLVCGIGDVLRPVVELEHQSVVAGVQRLFQRLGDVAGTATAAPDIADFDAVDVYRRAVHLKAQAHALLQRGDQCKHLECRSCGQPGLREIETVGVRAAVVRLDSTGSRVDRHHRRAHVGVLTVQRVLDRVLGRSLCRRIDRCRDLQALGVQRLLVDVEDLEQFVDHLPLDQPVGPRGLVLHAGQVPRDGRWKDLCGPVGRRQRADLHHPVEYPIPARRRRVRIDGRIKHRRQLDERGEQRALGDIELFDRLVEVGLRRGRHTVGAPTEIDDVQIRLQHLVLGPFARHLGRDDQFLGLADHPADTGPGIAHQRVLDVLLGDRRSALQISAEEVIPGRAHEPG